MRSGTREGGMDLRVAVAEYALSKLLERGVGPGEDKGGAAALSDEVVGLAQKLLVESKMMGLISTTRTDTAKLGDDSVKNKVSGRMKGKQVSANKKLYLAGAMSDKSLHESVSGKGSLNGANQHPSRATPKSSFTNNTSAKNEINKEEIALVRHGNYANEKYASSTKRLKQLDTNIKLESSSSVADNEVRIIIPEMVIQVPPDLFLPTTGKDEIFAKRNKCAFEDCTKNPRGASAFCIQHGGGKRCKFKNCSHSARGATNFCVTHGGGKRCSVDQCPKSAVGATNLCIAHGGGRRCQYPDCSHSAEGSTSFCIRHGGGRRCKTPECNKSAVGTTNYCVACGGGRRCQSVGCKKSAVGSTLFCKAHGGGRRCTHPSGCNKSAQGATFLCIHHGGGRRCNVEGCGRTVQGGAGGVFCKKHGATATTGESTSSVVESVADSMSTNDN